LIHEYRRNLAIVGIARSSNRFLEAGSEVRSNRSRDRDLEHGLHKSVREEAETDAKIAVADGRVAPAATR
jgi:hypothetical protein